MGEAKRNKLEAAAKALTDGAVDGGLIIEVGWLSLRAQAIPADASEIQRAEMREAFFAGAQHLFASIMIVLDSDSEPTERDMRRMDSIDRELRAFIAEYASKHMPTRGSA